MNSFCKQAVMTTVSANSSIFSLYCIADLGCNIFITIHTFTGVDYWTDIFLVFTSDTAGLIQAEGNEGACSHRKEVGKTLTQVINHSLQMITCTVLGNLSILNNFCPKSFFTALFPTIRYRSSATLHSCPSKHLLALE